jgi:hypothetical protein
VRTLVPRKKNNSINKPYLTYRCHWISSGDICNFSHLSSVRICAYGYVSRIIRKSEGGRGKDRKGGRKKECNRSSYCDHGWMREERVVEGEGNGDLRGVCIYVYMYICIYVCMYVCMYVCI